MQIRKAVLVGFVAVLAGCASAGSAGGDGETEVSRNTITMEQLDAATQPNAYEVVRSLKPAWLRRRGPDSFRSQTSLLVVVDDGQFHQLGMLQSLRPGDLREIRYVDPRTAMMKYGDRANGGAILVYTR